MSTCMVTGGAGFLGSHLCDELLARGNRVICVDNFETGSLANIEHIRDPSRFLYLQADIIDPYHVEEPVDFVYHLASPASPIDYLRLPLHTLKVGSYGTHHTLGLAKAKRARFLIASTSEVYGDPHEHPQAETYWGHVNPIGPRGVYDEAKRYAEALTMAYHRQQGVDTAIVRIFNTYGPPHASPRRPCDPDVPAPGACQPSAHGLRRRQPVPFLLLRHRPDPRHHRARRVRLSRTRQHRQPRRVHPARTGRDRPRVDGLDIGDRLRGAAGGRPQAAPPDISLARDLLGWSPKVSLREGLQLTIEGSGIAAAHRRRVSLTGGRRTAKFRAQQLPYRSDGKAQVF